jgi:hypothetical protein
MAFNESGPDDVRAGRERGLSKGDADNAGEPISVSADH